MTNDRDPLLHSLFADADGELDGEAFSARVMARLRFQRIRIVVPWICVALLLAAGAWFLAIPLEVAQLFAQILSTVLIDLGDGWLAWLFSPVNNIAAFLVLGVKALRAFRNKLIGMTYART